MAPLALPSRLEPVSVPIFAISWFVPRHVQAENGRLSSIVAYCGGGGSAKTGIQNAIFVNVNVEISGRKQTLTIPTGDEIGVALQVYQHGKKKSLWLVACVKNSVRRFRLPSGEPAGEIDVGQEVSTVSVHPSGCSMAVGCESGRVISYQLSTGEDDDETFAEARELFRTDQHRKAVCCIAFSELGNRLMTSGKDGIACIYNNAVFVSGFDCSVTDDNSPPPPAQRAPPQVIVKGCAFLDPHGHEAVTVASPRRGKSYIARWVQEDNGRFALVDKQVCHQNPISSFCLSADRTLLALGSSDGSVLLRDVPTWKTHKLFFEVHDFPVTGIAARPYPSATLLGEEDGVAMDARSASADGKLACLTRQRRGPKTGEQQGTGLVGVANYIIYALMLAYLLSPVMQEFSDKCGHAQGFAHRRRCLMDNVLIAPPTRPGVSVPPY